MQFLAELIIPHPPIDFIPLIYYNNYSLKIGGGKINLTSYIIKSKLTLILFSKEFSGQMTA